jgi:hypothetical protein
MGVDQLDRIFPYVCFAYGVLMTFAMNSPWLARIADERLPLPVQERWRANRGLALVCMVVGAAWILQNLWLL